MVLSPYGRRTDMWDAPAWNPPDSPPEDYHETLRLEGNARFEAKEYAAAAERYTEALGLLPERDRQSSQGSVLLSNLAAARLAQGRFEECLHDCNIGMSCKNATPEIRGKLYKRAAQAQTRLNKVSELYSAATTANKHWDSVRAMAQHDRALAGLESGELANAMRAKLLCGRSEVHAAMGSCKAALADAQMSVQVASTAEGRAAVMWGRIISDLEETKAKEQLSAAKAKFSAETESLRDSNVELRWQIHELKAELAATSAASEVQSHGALRFEALRVQSELTEWASSTVDMGRQTPRAASLNTVPVAQGASSTTNNPMDGLYWESTCPLCQLRSVVHPREVALLAAEARREMDQLGARMFVVQSRSLLSGRSKPWEEKWGTGWYAVRNKKKGTEEERRYFYIMPVGLPTGASKVNTTPRANSAKIKKGGWGLDEKHEALEVRKYCEAEFAKINWCRVGDLQDTNKVNYELMEEAMKLAMEKWIADKFELESAATAANMTTATYQAAHEEFVEQMFAEHTSMKRRLESLETVLEDNRIPVPTVDFLMNHHKDRMDLGEPNLACQRLPPSARK